MRVHANRDSALVLAAQASKAVPKITTIPELKGIHMEADARLAMLTMTATNQEVSIRASMPAAVEESGSAVIPADLLPDILKRLPGDQVSFSTVGPGIIHIGSSYAEYRLNILDAAKYAYGRGEKYTLELGADLSRALASEFVLLALPETTPLFLRKLQKKGLKQYQRREAICKGSGDIICMLDESDSAEEAAPWCKAVALALLDIAMRDQRRFAMIHFSGKGHFKTDLFIPRQYDQEDVLRAAELFLSGGTNYETPLQEALRLMEESGFENADMVFITDGACELPSKFRERLSQEQAKRGFHITGVLLDQDSGAFEFSLAAFCDEIIRTSELTREQIAERLVSSRIA